MCRGYGHMGKDCASEGGGKRFQRETGKGKAKGAGGKGTYNGKGKGFSALDEYWPAASGADPWAAVAAGLSMGPPRHGAQLGQEM